MQIPLLTVSLCEHWQPKRSLHCLYGFPLEYEHCLTFQSTKGDNVGESVESDSVGESVEGDSVGESVEGDSVEEFVEDAILINPINDNKPMDKNFIAYAFSQKKS